MGLAMILKPNINLHSGSMHLNKDQKKCVKVWAISSQCWSFHYYYYYYYESFVHHEYAPKIRQSTRNISSKLWKDCVM